MKNKSWSPATDCQGRLLNSLTPRLLRAGETAPWTRSFTAPQNGAIDGIWMGDFVFLLLQTPQKFCRDQTLLLVSPAPTKGSPGPVLRLCKRTPTSPPVSNPSCCSKWSPPQATIAAGGEGQGTERGAAVCTFSCCGISPGQVPGGRSLPGSVPGAEPDQTSALQSEAGITDTPSVLCEQPKRTRPFSESLCCYC